MDVKILDPKNRVDGNDTAALGQSHQPKLGMLTIFSETELGSLP